MRRLTRTGLHLTALLVLLIAALVGTTGAAIAEEQDPPPTQQESSGQVPIAERLQATATIIDPSSRVVQNISCDSEGGTYTWRAYYTNNLLTNVDLTGINNLQCNVPISVISGNVRLVDPSFNLHMLDEDSCASSGVDSCDILTVAGAYACVAGAICAGDWFGLSNSTFTLIFGSWTSATPNCYISGPNNNVLTCEEVTEGMYISPIY